VSGVRGNRLEHRAEDQPAPLPSHALVITSIIIIIISDVVLPERGGVPFRQIFLSGNGAPANIVYHRRNADTAAFWQISSGRGPVYYALAKC